MKCQSCDKEVGPGSAFCPTCGTKLQAGDLGYGENVLALIRGSTQPGLAKMTQFDLFVTPARLVAAKIGQDSSSVSGSLGELFLKGIELAASHAERKAAREKHRPLTLDQILKANKANRSIPFQAVTKLELYQGAFGTKIKIQTESEKTSYNVGDLQLETLKRVLPSIPALTGKLVGK